MYNETVKQRFLEDYLSGADGKRKRSAATERTLERIFDSIAPIEEACGCDFAKLSIEEMQRAFDAVSGIRSQSAEVAYYLLKQYIRWCILHGVGGGEAFKQIRLDSIENFRGCMVASPAHLKSSIDAAFPNPSENSIEYIYRASLWLAFIGFKEEEAAKILADDVHLNQMEITPQGFKEPFQIFAEARQDLFQAKTLQTFREPRGRKGVDKQRAVGDVLLRGKVTEKTMEEYLTTTVRQTVNRAFKKAIKERDEAKAQGKQRFENISLFLSYDRIYLSGVFYRAYEHERIGFDPIADFGALVELELSRKIAEGKYTISSNRTKGKIRNVLMKKYIDNYALWKCAFTA